MLPPLPQLATALKLKSVTEWHRSQNIWGLLEWQLNEGACMRRKGGVATQWMVEKASAKSKKHTAPRSVAHVWVGLHRVLWPPWVPRSGPGRQVEARAPLPGCGAQRRVCSVRRRCALLREERLATAGGLSGVQTEELQ